jgi:hypothetical protein
MWGSYKNYEAFSRHFQRNRGFNKKSEAFSKIMRLFEDIFNRIEAFLKWCKAFSKHSRLLKNIYRKIEVCFLHECGTFWKILRVFKFIFNEVEVFVEKYKAFVQIKRNGGFGLEMWGFYKDFNYFWRLFQRNSGFLNTFLQQERLF